MSLLVCAIKDHKMTQIINDLYLPFLRIITYIQHSIYKSYIDIWGLWGQKYQNTK